MRRVYLDHQASTPVLPEAVEAMLPYYSERYASQAALHQEGLAARDALDRSREQFARFIHAEPPEDIIFTSGGTEAINLAVKGVAYASRRQGNHLVVSEIEHPAVLQSADFLGENGFEITRVPVDPLGRIDPEAVVSAITEQTILVCLHHGNYDVGTVQPIATAAKLTREKGVPLFVDATYSGGWLPVDVQQMGIDLLALSPHRFYGPKGVGVLYKHRRARLAPILHGGIQENHRRAGMENVPAIVGAGVAAEAAARELDQRRAHVGRLQRRLWEGLKDKIPYLKLNGPEPGEQRLSTNLNLSVEFTEGEGLALMCDMRGIRFSSGTACVAKSLKVSPVLDAIGLSEVLALASIILSPGKDNTEEEIDYAIETIVNVVERLRGMSPAWEEFQSGVIHSETAENQAG